MNRQVFSEAQSQIRSSGLVIADAVYAEAIFGSWHITVKRNPRCRVVWDGKEQRLAVEEETAETFNGSPVWNELWLTREPTVEVIRTGIRKLIEKCQDK